MGREGQRECIVYICLVEITVLVTLLYYMTLLYYIHH